MAIYKIFENEIEINTIVADEDFIIPYCKENGYTYEVIPEPEPEPILPEPTQLDEIQSLTTYTAMMTGTLPPTPATMSINSLYFDNISKWYSQGLWNDEMLINAVDKGTISTDEFKNIIGEK